MSSGVTKGELDQIRADVEDQILPDTGTILETVNASDGQGGHTETLKARAGGKDVECRIDPLRQKAGDPESSLAGKPTAISAWLITFPAETVVRATDVIEVGGTKYAAKRVRERGAWKLCVRVEATLVDAGGPAAKS